MDVRNRFANLLIGGWSMNGIYNWEIGAPIFWQNNVVYCPAPSPACNGFGGAININNRNGNGQAFNLQAFDLQSQDQPQYNIRTFSSTFNTLRVDSPNNLDASLIKRFQFTETTYLQLRFEVFNALNHPVFASPSVTQPTSSTFGLIQNTANNPRSVQLGARFVW